MGSGGPNRKNPSIRRHGLSLGWRTKGPNGPLISIKPGQEPVIIAPAQPGPYPPGISIGEQALRSIVADAWPGGDWQFNTRPAFLIGKRKHPLELDIYSPTLKLAFEYNGAQHYRPLDGQANFASQQSRDATKRKLCAKEGVLLISLWRRHVTDPEGLAQRIREWIDSWQRGYQPDNLPVRQSHKPNHHNRRKETRPTSER